MRSTRKHSREDRVGRGRKLGVGVLVGTLALTLGVTLLPATNWLPKGFSSDAAAAAKSSKVTICHRTKSASNPYRRITVSSNAVTGNGTSKHTSHTGDSWISGAVSPWGDIIPDDTVGVNGVKQLNYASGGGSTTSEKRGYAIYKGESYSGVNYSGKCGTMTAKQFYDVQKAAGVSDAEILQDLEDQGAVEDLALKASLGGTFVGQDVTLLSSISATTLATTSISLASGDATAKATLNGTLTVGTTSTTPSFLYGTTNPPTTSVSAGSAVTGSNNAVAASLTGLTPDTVYYVQVVGSYTVADPASTTTPPAQIDGSISGSVVSFRTPSASKANQAITFAAIANTQYGQTVAIDPTADSGLIVSIESVTPDICSIANKTVTLLTIGKCTLIASQGGGTSGAISYNAAESVSRSFDVTKADQSITWSDITDKVATDPAFSVSPSASSSLAVTLASNSPSICTVSSATISLTGTGTGTCSITASQTGNSYYNAAPTVTKTFTVKKNQTISFAAITSKTPDEMASGIDLSPTASSNLTVTLESLDTSVCTVSGFKVSRVDNGTCQLRAKQSGDSAYYAAPQVDRSFTISNVAKSNRTLTVGAGSTSLLYSGTTTLTATASQADTDGAKSWSVSSGDTVCSISGSTLTAIGVGSCTITAAITEGASYNAATSGTETITVAKANRTITVQAAENSLNPTDTTTLSSSTSGGGAQTYSVKTGGSNCSISGTTLTADDAGTCTLGVSIAEDSYYNAATSTNSLTITITRLSRTLNLTAASTSIASGATTTLTASQSAGSGVITYAVASGPCTVSSATLTGTSAGTCSVTATIGASGKYASATSSSVSVTVTASSGGGGTGGGGNSGGGTGGGGNSGGGNSGGGNSGGGNSGGGNSGGGNSGGGAGSSNSGGGNSVRPASNGPVTPPATPPSGGNPNSNQPVAPLPTVTVPLTTSNNTPVVVTNVDNKGPGSVQVDNKGQLKVTVPIGFTGTLTVVVKGFTQDDCTTLPSGAVACPVGTQAPIQQTIQIPVAGPKPEVVPDQQAAALPRGFAPRSGEVVVLGMDGEVGLNWKPEAGSQYYEVSSGGETVCMTVYTSCIVSAPNRKSRTYVVTAVKPGGATEAVAKGTGWAKPSGTRLASVYFDSASGELNKKALRALRKMVRDAKAVGIASVYVVGHTDTLGSVTYNRKLSAKRALNVRAWIKKYLPNAVFNNKSQKGEINPKFSERDRPGDWRNRRVDILVQ